MKTTFISLMALGIAAAMASPADRALAGEPMVLTGTQLDQVTAGGRTLTVRVVTPAHELTHVVQQGQSPAGGTLIVLTDGAKGTQGNSHDRLANVEVSYMLPSRPSDR